MPQPARQGPVQPGSIQEKVMYARELATASNLPRAYQNSPGDLLLAMSYADALGIPLINAITQVKPIDGVPSASATLIRGLVIKAGHRVRSGWARKPDIDSDQRAPLLNAPSKLDPDLTVAWCEIVRKDDPDFPYRQEWTLRRAEVAQLLRIVNGAIVSKTGSNNKSSNWEKSPIAMLPHRALTSCAREACPEAILGIFTADELGAEVSDDGHVDHYVDAVEPAVTGTSGLKAISPEVVEAADHPSEFEQAVQHAESQLDLEKLQDLGSLAKQEKDPAGVALARAAWLRTRDVIAQHQEDDPVVAAANEAATTGGSVAGEALAAHADELAAHAEEEPPTEGE